MITKSLYLSQLFSSIGVVSVLTIMLVCLVQVFSPRIKEGVLGCIFYLGASTACIAWLINMIQGTFPHRTTVTLLSFIAGLMLRRLVLSTDTWARFKCWYFMKIKEAKAFNRSR